MATYLPSPLLGPSAAAAPTDDTPPSPPPPPEIPEELWAVLAWEGQAAGGGAETRTKARREVHRLKLLDDLHEGELAWGAAAGGDGGSGGGGGSGAAVKCGADGAWALHGADGQAVAASEKSARDGWLPHEAGEWRAGGASAGGGPPRCVVARDPPPVSNPARPAGLRLSLCAHRESGVVAAARDAARARSDAAAQRAAEARRRVDAARDAELLEARAAAVAAEPPPLAGGSAAARAAHQRAVMGGGNEYGGADVPEHRESVVPAELAEHVNRFAAYADAAAGNPRDVGRAMQQLSEARQQNFEQARMSAILRPRPLARVPKMPASEGGVAAHLAALRRSTVPVSASVPRSAALATPRRPTSPPGVPGSAQTQLSEASTAGGSKARWLRGPSMPTEAQQQQQQTSSVGPPPHSLPGRVLRM